MFGAGPDLGASYLRTFKRSAMRPQVRVSSSQPLGANTRGPSHTSLRAPVDCGRKAWYPVVGSLVLTRATMLVLAVMLRRRTSRAFGKRAALRTKWTSSAVSTPAELRVDLARQLPLKLTRGIGCPVLSCEDGFVLTADGQACERMKGIPLGSLPMSDCWSRAPSARHEAPLHEDKLLLTRAGLATTRCVLAVPPRPCPAMVVTSTSASYLQGTYSRLAENYNGRALYLSSARGTLLSNVSATTASPSDVALAMLALSATACDIIV